MKALAGEVLVHPDADDLARSAAEDLLSEALEAVRVRGVFTIALTGGSSPVALYRLLGEESVAARVPWAQVHLFWGDDRVVPPAHPRSNFGLAHHLFLGRVPIPPANIHRVRGELGRARAAREYSAEISAFFEGNPRFDLVHLGLGGDGHVASLFPFDHAALLERDEAAISTLFRDLGEWRVSLTYPVLNGARRVEFLLPSAEKERIARTAMLGPIDPIRIPAQGIRPAGGVLIWRVTRDLARAAEAAGKVLDGSLSP